MQVLVNSAVRQRLALLVRRNSNVHGTEKLHKGVVLRNGQPNPLVTKEFYQAQRPVWENVTLRKGEKTKPMTGPGMKKHDGFTFIPGEQGGRKPGAKGGG